MSNIATITSTDVVRAQELILAGDVLRIRVDLNPQQPSSAADWIETLNSPEVLVALETSGHEAVTKALGEGYRVIFGPIRANSLQYRVVTYRRLGDDVLRLTPAGKQLEKKLFRAMADLTERVEKIGSTAAETPLVAIAEWKPGPGLSLATGTTAQGIGDQDLQGRIHELDAHARSVRRRFLIGAVLGAALVLGGIVGGALLDVGREVVAGAGAYGLVFILLALLFRARASEAEQEIRETRDQLDLRELLDDPREQRAQKQFQVHSHQVRRYYDQALRQRSIIFWVGVLCILAGFGIVVAAGLVITEGSSDLSEQIVVGALGAIGGILANFIAVVYLRMFSDTLKSIGGFHDRLVITHHLHFANVLAAKVDSDDLREQTLAGMAAAMAMSEHKNPES